MVGPISVFEWCVYVCIYMISRGIEEKKHLIAGDGTLCFSQILRTTSTQHKLSMYLLRICAV